jgi:hypothetical protein
MPYLAMNRRLIGLVVALLLAPRVSEACVFFDDQAVDGASTEASTSSAATAVAPPAPATAQQLDFDLLEKPPAGIQVDLGAVARRRTMLNVHQAVGLGMFAVALANTVVGQLNYSDRFANGPSSGKYQLAHTLTASATLIAFAGTGLLALLAPTPIPKEGSGIDRLTVHKISMATAAAGMLAETVLGIYTASREGRLNQPDFAAAHLAIGYVTFAAISLGVGVIVF